MTENKRFGVTDHTDNPYLCDWNVTDYSDGAIVHMPMTSENMANEICDLLNELNDENMELKKELQIYRKVASCSNCHYHDYDWYDDGDDFEVCDKGNDVTEGICKEWRKF